MDLVGWGWRLKGNGSELVGCLRESQEIGSGPEQGAATRGSARLKTVEQEAPGGRIVVLKCGGEFGLGELLLGV